MTDLTDKWKKGEFIICNAGKCQYYYVQNEEQREVIKTEYCLFDDNTPNWQILAPVPSYEEWEQLQNWADFTNDYHELREKLEIAEYENAMLKELLKECKQWFDWYHIDTTTGKEYIESWHKKGYEIHKKIDEALR